MKTDLYSTELLSRAAKLKKPPRAGSSLPETQKKSPRWRKLSQSAPAVLLTARTSPMSVNVGDKVIYSKYAGNEVKLDGEEYIIVRQS